VLLLVHPQLVILVGKQNIVHVNINTKILK